MYAVQINKSNEVKASCIQRFMPALYPDPSQFWIEFMKQVNILTDSRRFCRECITLGYQPENVAEHVVFLGSAPMRKVLREGVQNILGATIQFYKVRFSPIEADAYREGGGRGANSRPACQRRGSGITPTSHSKEKGATETIRNPYFHSEQVLHGRVDMAVFKCAQINLGSFQTMMPQCF